MAPFYSAVDTFAISPKLLLLDEPFGALDALTRGSIQDELLKVWAGTDQTVFMITHDIDEAILLADRILLMTNGPYARVAESVDITIPRPRNRTEIVEHPNYYAIRNHLVQFLGKRSKELAGQTGLVEKGIIEEVNRVVKEEAAFALHSDKTVHQLTRLNTYVAPFQQQLKDIHDVAVKGKEPDHQTGNAVRSVLEAVGRFCRPDHDSLTNFITFLAGQDDLEIKSVMINSLSHGTYYEETPPPDDLKLACEETIKVVKKFAVGQLEILR